jgi:ubiquitin-like-conjugating enzyme ATG10
MSHRDDYRHWPFLTEEEFALACAFFDQRYIRATLGPTRKVLKIISRRTATTGVTYIEILRLLQPPKEDEDLALALESLGGFGGGPATDAETDIEMAADDDDQVCNPSLSFSITRPLY